MLHIRPAMTFCCGNQGWRGMALVSTALIVSFFAPSAWCDEAGGASAKVTFNRDIAPIVFNYCSSCHRAGEAGPFPLITYQDVKKHGHQIVAVTQSRFMPPCPPSPDKGKTPDKKGFSDQQFAPIRAWGNKGWLQGNPVD